MCFSANASFLASGLLLAVGAATVATARQQPDRQSLPLAMAPLFFGLQQALEGLVWLGLEAPPPLSGQESPVTSIGPVLGYLFFAYAFWPLWIPWSAVCLLPRFERRGRLWKRIAALGLVPGLVLWLPLVSRPESVLPVRIGHSLVYPLAPWSEGLLPGLVGPTLYAAWLVIFLLLVPSWRVRVFALSLLLAFGFTEWATSQALTSVWCYASALLSMQILWILHETGIAPESRTETGLLDVPR